MRVALLGPLLVEHDGATVLIGGQRLRALFIRLALEPSRWVTSSTLANALWDGEEPPADPTNALQSLVSRLRRLLPDPQLLESSGSGYRLLIAPDDVDATCFEELAAQGRRLLASGQPEAAAKALDAAHALWQGAPLADLDGAAFTQPYVSHLEQLHDVANEDRYEAALALGRPNEIVAELERVVAAEPLREHAAALLVRALAAAGRQADALAAYERTRSGLVDELGLDPSPELAAAHQAVLVGVAPVSPPKRTRNNLPTALTSFVGRDPELQRIGELLTTHRLVTLTGPGGAGKTRLCIAGGHSAIRDAEAGGGVWLVELAPLSDPGELAAAALGAISGRESNLLETALPARDALTRLVDLLAGRRVLLLLDNCEHVIGGAAEMADQLLARCPELRILATSREPLAITGEAICPVLPLGMPSTGITAEASLQFASVRLFADRAASVSPGFTVDESSVAAVIEICRRLDGLPLAIELAAARLRTLPVAMVAERLIDRFRLLTGGSRTAVARHQTLRSVVAWSWDLLTARERELAESLAVFHGGITVDSATAVSDAGSDDTLDLLVALADKSILQPVSGRALRWRMLETLREFGTEQLAARGRTDAVRHTHAEYFCSLAERAEPLLRGPQQVSNVKLLSAERDNINAGMRYSIDRGDVCTAVRYGAALAWYWHLVGGEVDAAGWLSQIVRLPGGEDEAGYLLCVVGWAFTMVGSGARDEDAKNRSRRLAEQLLAKPGMEAHPLLMLLEISVAMLNDDDQAAKAILAQQLNHPDPWARAALQLISGLLAENAGDLDGLRAAGELALRDFRVAGDRWGMAMALALSAGVAVMDGKLPTALAQFAEAVDLLEDLGSADEIAFLLMRQAQALERSGDRTAARATLQRSHDLAEQSGSASFLAMTEFAMAQQPGAFESPDAARTFIENAIRRAEAAPNVFPQALAFIYNALCRLEGELGEFETARGHATTAWKLAIGSHDMPVVAASGLAYASVVLERGQPELAVRLLGASDSIRGAADLSDPDAKSLIVATRKLLGGLADTALAEGRALSQQAALALLETALTTSA